MLWLREPKYTQASLASTMVSTSSAKPGRSSIRCSKPSSAARAACTAALLTRPNIGCITDPGDESQRRQRGPAPRDAHDRQPRTPWDAGDVGPPSQQHSGKEGGESDVLVQHDRPARPMRHQRGAERAVSSPHRGTGGYERDARHGSADGGHARAGGGCHTHLRPIA